PRSGRFFKSVGRHAPEKFLLEPLDLAMHLQLAAGPLRNLSPVGGMPVDAPKQGVQPVPKGSVTIHAANTAHLGELAEGQAARGTTESGGLNPFRPASLSEVGAEEPRQQILRAEPGIQPGEVL